MGKNKGFTLVELMIVVAIIGILAMIAVPNFLHYVMKTKRSEAKYNLEAIYRAELSWFGEYDTFSNSFAMIRWRPEGSTFYYSYTLGNEVYGKNPPEAALPGAYVPGADSRSFTAFAWGNIDNDPTLDVWSVNEQKVMANEADDLGG